MDLDALADRFFEHGATGDAAAIAAMCTPDCRVKQNIGDEGDVSSLVAIVEGIAAGGMTVEYSEVRRVVAERAVTEQHLVTITRSDGVQASTDICVILRFDDHGRITRLDEYLDSAALAPIFG